MLRRRLWFVSFLTIFFEGDNNCHLIWGTKRWNIIFIYCIRLRHIDVMCLTWRWRHWCVNCIFALFLQVLKPAKSQQLVGILLIIERQWIWDISKFSFQPLPSKLRQQIIIMFCHPAGHRISRDNMNILSLQAVVPDMQSVKNCAF